MDAFVSRSRPPKPKTAISVPPTGPPTTSHDDDDDDDTELKLALLSSLQLGLDQHVLLEALLAHEGDVEAAYHALDERDAYPPRKKTKTSGASGYQASLASFNLKPSGAKGDASVQSRTKKGRTLHLFSPEDVEINCPCTLVHNFLPGDLATALLRELLDESPTYTRERFQLFDNVVQSPHTTAFYIDGWEEAQRQKTEYMYNGSVVRDVRATLPYMQQASAMVQEAVNREVGRRVRDFYPDGKKLKYMTKDRWAPNSAFVNCYDGGKESVGYHSDQLTYLGPRAVIGSLSLGVAREFRIRKIVARDGEGDESLDVASGLKRKPGGDKRADEEGQIAIHLPHNSLLVMQAEMQEEWKHSIAPAQTVTPHPVAGNKRLNITYRHYRSYLDPKFTPKCKCSVPCVLKCMQRKQLTRGRYYWMCNTNFTPGKAGCGHFEWAVFDGDGRPPWADGFKGDGIDSDSDHVEVGG